MASWQEAPVIGKVPGWKSAPVAGQEQPNMMDGAVDFAKSVGSGVVSGIEGAATAPIQIGDWLGGKAIQGIDYLRGVDPAETEQTLEAVRGMSKTGIGPQDVLPPIADKLGANYQPKSELSEYGKTFGQFIPTAIAGPGKLADKALTATTAAIGSEWGGQMAEDYLPKGTEPYARLMGAMLGGSIPRATAPSPNKAMRDAAPTRQAVRSEKNALFKNLENAGVKYDANAYGQWANQLQARLAKEGLDPTLHPQATAVLKRVMDEVGNSPDFVKLETLRKLAGEATRGNAMTNAADLDRAGVILREIDTFFNNSPLVSNGSIPAGQVASTAKQARELSRRNIMARDIEEMQRKSGNYLAGSESGNRNQFKSYLNSAKGKMLTPSEEAAFKKVITREGVEGVIHNHGSRLANIIGAGAAGAAGYAGQPSLGVAAWLGSNAVNLGARKLSEVMTDKKVRDAMKTVLAGKDAQSAASAATRQLSQQQRAALVRALIASNPELVGGPR